MRQVTISVPATTANLGPGFDCLGMALNLRHRVTLSITANPGLQITAAGEDAHLIPRDTSNLVYQAMQPVFGRVGGKPVGIKIHQDNEIPIASGLGSSSSAVLAGMFGANALAGSPLAKEQVLQMATDLEGHPDNVAPAVYGGLVLGVQTTDGLLVEKIPVQQFKVLVVLPDFDLQTEKARAVLPQQISLDDAIYNTSRLGLLIRALETANFQDLSIAMQDRLHHPYRIPIIDGMADAFQAAREAGAAGVALSGAGPSLIAFASEGHASIGTAVAAAFKDAGLDSRQWLLIIDKKGIGIQTET